MANYPFAFTILGQSDGCYTVIPGIPEDVTTERAPTVTEVTSACNEIVSDLQITKAVDRIMAAIGDVINPVEPTVAARVSEALRDRDVR